MTTNWSAPDEQGVSTGYAGHHTQWNRDANGWSWPTPTAGRPRGQLRGAAGGQRIRSGGPDPVHRHQRA